MVSNDADCEWNHQIQIPLLGCHPGGMTRHLVNVTRIIVGSMQPIYNKYVNLKWLLRSISREGSVGWRQNAGCFPELQNLAAFVSGFRFAQVAGSWEFGAGTCSVTRY